MMRLLNRLYARFFGYFWLPCVLCGKHFGGHEWKGENTISVLCEGVCPRCGNLARAINAILDGSLTIYRKGLTIEIELTKLKHFSQVRTLREAWEAAYVGTEGKGERKAL